MIHPSDDQPTRLPAHAEANDLEDVHGGGINWGAVLAVVVVVALLVTIVVLHLTGVVGPVGHSLAAAALEWSHACATNTVTRSST